MTRSRLGLVFSMSAAAGGAAGTAKLCYIRYHRKLELRERPAIVASCVVSRLADGRRCCKRSKGRTSLNGIALATNPVSTPWPLLRPGFWPSKWSGLAVLTGLDVSHVFDTPIPTYCHLLLLMITYISCPETCLFHKDLSNFDFRHRGGRGQRQTSTRLSAA